MINTQLSGQSLVFCANESIQALAKGKAELETLRVKLVKERGDEKLELCLRIIERLAQVMVLAPLVLAFAVSPWTLVITPVAIVAFIILHAYNADRFGSDILARDYLPSYKDRLEASGIPTENSLHPPVKLEELDLEQRVKFFLNKKTYVLDAQKIEKNCQSHLNTLRAIACLFSALNQLEKEKSKELASSLAQADDLWRNSSLGSKDREGFSTAFIKIKSHSTAIQQKLDEMRKTKTLSTDAILNYIARLPLDN